MHIKDRPFVVFKRPLLDWHKRVWQAQSGWQQVTLFATIFWVVMLVIALNRYYSFYASYDQGLFTQVFWNSLRGHFFQSSLSSSFSGAVVMDGQVPSVFYNHLGQHFVLDFLLWLPIYALFPSGATLVVIQVTLIAIAGLVLYALARHYLEPPLAVLITASFYGANAVIGPTFANFYEHCQIPLFAFSTLLALEKRRWFWCGLFALLTLMAREDAGILLFGIGFYLAISRRQVLPGLGLCALSFGYVVLVTNKIMPLFSNDNSRLYLELFFGQYVQQHNPTTLQLLWGIVTHPREVLVNLFTPLDKRINYLLGHWVPLAFVPSLSAAAWTMISFPLLVLLLQKNNSALAINVRYALALAPGLFYGTILWWSQHQHWLQPRLRRFWIGCITLSIILSVVYSPNRAFFFLMPDSYRPWVHVSLARQWEHVGNIRSVLATIPPDAGVSGTTFLIPHIADRRAALRLPALQTQNDQHTIVEVDYAIADFWQLKTYEPAFKGDRLQIQAIIPLFDQLLTQSKYGIQALQDGVVLLQKNAPSNPQALASWVALKQELEPVLQKK